MINVLVNGATGKMGRLAVKHIQKNPKLQLAATPKRLENLAQAIAVSHADIVLDLTVADTVFQNTKIIIENNCIPVIGTSGLTATEIIELKILAKHHNVGGIIVPNFSLGAVLMMQFAEMASIYFNDIQIVETHHLNKKDKPSGTARATAERIATAKKIAYETIPITSHREAAAVAEQEVIFKTPYEILSIKHNSFDRESFMLGIMLACEKAPQLTELLVGLEHLL